MQLAHKTIAKSRPKAPPLPTTVGVYRDHNAHVCIVFKVGRVNTHYVEFDIHRLIARSMDSRLFRAVRGFEPMQYDLQKALARFLQHPQGVSSGAQDALRSLLVTL
jgi:hypothetical protein